MIFRTDKQTREDLSIFSRTRGRSVYDIYNDTKTRRGGILAEKMFGQPLADFQQINDRLARIRFFYDKAVRFPFDPSAVDTVEKYLGDTDERNRILPHEGRLLEKKIHRLLKVDTPFRTAHAGITAMCIIIKQLSEFIGFMGRHDGFKSLFPESELIRGILSDPGFRELAVESGSLSPAKVARYDNLLRGEAIDGSNALMDFISVTDLYTSLAGVVRRGDYCLPEIRPASDNILEIKNVFHPQLDNPVADNYLRLDSSASVIFLTGANMAGKSTFMKSFSIAVYLAHLGFPVPASSMTFSVRNGLYTSINLADDLNQGYSHFYSEVMRIKKVALDMKRYGNIIVIFDELFRGTNVRDAYEGTVAVTEAFSAVQDSLFVVSTHILEAGEYLRDKCPNIEFVHFPTVMNGNRPTYTYKLTPGITADRHGMLIVANEGILELLKSKNLNP